MADRQGSAPRRLGVGVGCVVAVVVCVGILLARRHADGLPSVDDYLYTTQARAYAVGLRHGPGALVDAWRAYGPNSPLVPLIGAPVTTVSSSPFALLAVQLAIYLTLLPGVLLLLRQLGLRTSHALVGATAIGLVPAVTDYVVMVSYALAATSALVWCCVAYLRSGGLRRRRPTLALGVLLGVLSLTRVVALVYLAAFLVVVVITQLARRRDPGGWLANAGLGLLLGAVVAAPWWLTAGPTAVRYLLSAGYDAASGFAPRASLPQRFSDRLVVTVGQTGLLVSLLLLAGAVGAVLLGLRSRQDADDADRSTGGAFVGGVALLTLVGLGTSSNAGTAFALPAVVLAAVATIALLPRLPARRLLVAVGAAVLAVAVLGQDGALPQVAVAGRPLWARGYPGYLQGTAALGDDAVPLHVATQACRQVGAALAGTRVVVLRDDDACNVFALSTAGAVDIGTVGYGDRTVTASDLQGAGSVVAGRTPAAFHGSLDEAAVPGELTGAGFGLACREVLSPVNDIDVWRRGARTPAVVPACG